MKWFTSYLSDRKMRVRCTSANTGQMEYSTYYDLDYGTPQGSCLGPLLFLIYINDLHHTVEHCSIILFTDDTTLLQGHRSLKYLKWMIEEDLRNMIDWFKANLLTINVSKTECILFHYSNKTTPTPFEIDLSNITLKSSEWTHISNLIMKIKQNTNLLKTGNKFLTKSSKKLVYYAHIYRYGHNMCTSITSMDVYIHNIHMLWIGYMGKHDGHYNKS